jgi:large conductance mechanosensitive channel
LFNARLILVLKSECANCKINNPKGVRELRKAFGIQGFVKFVREQGVVGLAVGFILGGSVSNVVSSLVDDIINPLLGIVLGAAGDLSTAHLEIGSAKIMYGSFISVLIDFLVIALVVYYGVKALRLEKLDIKKKAKVKKR